MSVVKAFRFPVAVHWRGGRLTLASAPGKGPLEIATPPEFKGGVAGVWSPEDLLVASAASCFAVTLAAVAERSGVELETLEVAGLGHVERGSEGRFRFVAIELTVELETETDNPDELERVVRESERLCIVSLALDVPVHVRVVGSAVAAVGRSE